MQKLSFAFIITIFLTIGSTPVFAESESFVLGGKAGWPALSYESNLVRRPGKLGQESLVLTSVLTTSSTAAARAAPAAAPNARDDMYISFDSGTRDETGNYTIVSSALLRSDASKARRGAGAALSNTGGKGLVVRGLPGSLFGTTGDSRSFSIEFWLCPSVVENGSVLLHWRSSRITKERSFYQYISGNVSSNHIEWTFSNLWSNIAGNPFDVSISGRKNLIPGVWSHHVVSYESETGALEYCVDGLTENIVYLTSTGTERGDVFAAIFGVPGDVELCPSYSGIIDEIIFSRNSTRFDTLESKHVALERFPSGGGRFESMPLDSGTLNSTFLRLDASVLESAGTGTAFFVRSGDNFYQWTETEPAWIPVEPGKKSSGITGRYFQIAGELYADGTGSATPSVTQVSLTYEKDSPPWPPVRVLTEALDGAIGLSWPASVDSDVAGYLVYYGDHPGEYLASGSPIDNGSVRTCTVTGLKNGKVYYFSIAAYDASGSAYPGTLSQEVYARPRALRGE
jgi:hypothetical protein